MMTPAVEPHSMKSNLRFCFASSDAQHDGDDSGSGSGFGSQQLMIVAEKRADSLLTLFSVRRE